MDSERAVLPARAGQRKKRATQTRAFFFFFLSPKFFSAALRLSKSAHTGPPDAPLFRRLARVQGEGVETA